MFFIQAFLTCPSTQYSLCLHNCYYSIYAYIHHRFMSLIRCDFGYTGETCEQTVARNPTVLLENFYGTSLQLSAGIESIRGASLSYDCDVVSTGKAAVFNQDGQRELVTAELNTTNSMYGPCNNHNSVLVCFSVNMESYYLHVQHYMCIWFFLFFTLLHKIQEGNNWLMFVATIYYLQWQQRNFHNSSAFISGPNKLINSISPQ